MRRWLFPLLAGVVLAIVAYYAILAAAPGFIMGKAVERIGEAGGMNRMMHAPLPGPGRRTVVRPSPDLAYSACPFDLSKGPLLIEVVPVPAPYWSLSVFDERTDVAYVRNNRDTGGAPIRVALVGPKGQVPQGVETVRLRGNRGVALIRILLEDRARFGEIDHARQPSNCRAL